MTIQTLTFECKKDSFRQAQDGTVKLVLSIHPEDVKPELLMAAAGQQFMAVLAPINGGEPAQIEAKEKREWKDLSHTEQAGILCASPDFIRYLKTQRSILWDNVCKFLGAGVSDEAIAAECVRDNVGVYSRKDIKRENTAGAKFRHLCAEYFEWKDKQ